MSGRRPDILANYRRQPLPPLERIPFRAIGNDQMRALLDAHVDELRAAAVTKDKRPRVRKDVGHNVTTPYNEQREQAYRTQSGQGYTAWPRLAEAFYTDLDRRRSR